MNISYDLAVALKDAGVPQDLKRGDWIYNEQKQLVPLHDQQEYIQAIERKETIVRVPFLDELIELCGKIFSSLEQDEDGWICYFFEADWDGDRDCTGVYKSAYDAVAALCLSILRRTKRDTVITS